MSELNQLAQYPAPKEHEILGRLDELFAQLTAEGRDRAILWLRSKHAGPATASLPQASWQQQQGIAQSIGGRQ